MRSIAARGGVGQRHGAKCPGRGKMPPAADPLLWSRAPTKDSCPKRAARARLGARRRSPGDRQPPVSPLRIATIVVAMTNPAPHSTRPVLVAVDFSTSSNEALRQAAARAKALETKLIVLHVVHQPASILPDVPHLPTYYLGNPKELEQAARQRLLDLLETQHVDLERSRLQVEVDVSPTPYAAIVARAEQHATQLVVVGHRGHVGLSRLLLGSVAQRVARACACPVLVARASSPSRRVLATTDFSETAQRGVEYAVEQAQRSGFQVLLHHHLELPTPLWSGLAPLGPIPPQVDEQTVHQLRQSAEQLLRDTLTRTGATGAVVVTSGSRTDEAIVRVAEEHGVELIVMASHGRSGVARLTLGSVTESVLLHAPCSVLAVREG